MNAVNAVKPKGTETKPSDLARFLQGLNEVRKKGDVTVVGSLGPDDIVRAGVEFPLANYPNAMSAIWGGLANGTDETSVTTNSDKTIDLSITTHRDGKKLRPEEVARDVLQRVSAVLEDLLDIRGSAKSLDIKIPIGKVYAEFIDLLRQKDVNQISGRLPTPIDDAHLNDPSYMHLLTDRAIRGYVDSRSSEGLTLEVLEERHVEVLEERHSGIESLQEKVIKRFKELQKEEADLISVHRATDLKDSFSQLADDTMGAIEQIIGDSPSINRLRSSFEAKSKISTVAANVCEHLEHALNNKKAVFEPGIMRKALEEINAEAGQSLEFEVPPLASGPYIPGLLEFFENFYSILVHAEPVKPATAKKARVVD